MNQIDYIMKMIERKRDANINVSIHNDDGIMFDCYDIWFDHDVSLYCLQKLYVYKGKVDEIGDTITCDKEEIELTLMSLSQRGTLKVNISE